MKGRNIILYIKMNINFLPTTVVTVYFYISLARKTKKLYKYYHCLIVKEFLTQHSNI